MYKRSQNFAAEYYNKNGWGILRNFFDKHLITNVKKQMLKKISKKNDNSHFYYEYIGSRKRLRRIERISDLLMVIHLQ